MYHTHAPPSPSSFEAQCVLPPGTSAPPDPGPAEPHASSLGTVYHRLGGVYPIAHFADPLVDKTIAVGSGVTLKDLGEVTDPTARRHAPGLKYLLTEVRNARANLSLCTVFPGPHLPLQLEHALLHFSRAA